MMDRVLSLTVNEKVRPEMTELALNIVEEHREYSADQNTTEMRQYLPRVFSISRTTPTRVLNSCARTQFD